MSSTSYTAEAIHFEGTPPVITALAAGELEIGPLAFSSFALAIQQIPAHLSDAMVALGRDHGATVFVAVSALLMIGFGAVLEGAPALIILGEVCAGLGNAAHHDLAVRIAG